MNNAGIASFGDVEFTSMEKYQRVADINLWGTIRVTKAFLPLIRRARGRKEGLEGLWAKHLAQEWTQSGWAAEFCLHCQQGSADVLGGSVLTCIQTAKAEGPVVLQSACARVCILCVTLAFLKGIPALCKKMGGGGQRKDPQARRKRVGKREACQGRATSPSRPEQEANPIQVSHFGIMRAKKLPRRCPSSLLWMWHN